MLVHRGVQKTESDCGTLPACKSNDWEGMMTGALNGGTCTLPFMFRAAADPCEVSSVSTSVAVLADILVQSSPSFLAEISVRSP